MLALSMPRMCIGVVLACAAAVPSVKEAFAAPPGSEPELRDLPLRDDELVAPDWNRYGQPEAPPQRQGPAVFYLNYDGAQLNPGQGSNTQTNTSFVCAGSFSPFGNNSQLRDASVQATRQDWAPYNVTIVTERPTSGDYSMNVVGKPAGGNSGAGCGAGLGVAPVDCENMNPNDISFSWITGSDGYSAITIATTNSQELAHTLGLAHVDDPASIMHPSGGRGDPEFLDRCIQIPYNNYCPQQHQRHCTGGAQNSHQEILELLGTSVPDTEDPVVTITAPGDGAEFEAPASFSVVADASDDVGVAEVRILIDGMDQGSPLGTAPFSWDLSNVPVGSYTFAATAKDGAGNETTSSEVTIEVVPAGGPGDDEDGDAGDDGGGDGDGGSDGDDDGGADDGGGDGDWPDPYRPDGGGQVDRGGGCGCRAPTAPAPTAALFLVAGMGLGRRRAGTRP